MKIETKFDKGDKAIHRATNEKVEILEVSISIPVRMPGTYNGVSYQCRRLDGSIQQLQEEWLSATAVESVFKIGDQVGFTDEARTALNINNTGATGKVVEIIPTVTGEPQIKFKRDNDVFNSHLTASQSYLERREIA